MKKHDSGPERVLRHLPASLAVLVLALAVLAACGGDKTEGEEGGPVVVVTTPTAKPTRVATPTASPTPSPTPSPTQACSFNPDPAPPSLLQVIEPKAEQRVGIPFHLRGWGSTIGQSQSGVAIGILDGKGKILQTLPYIPAQPRAGRVLPPGLENTANSAPFAADILLSGLAGPTPICVWVYLETTADGTPKKVVQVPLLVTP